MQNILTPPGIYREPLCIVKQFDIPTLFNPEIIKVVRIIIQNPTKLPLLHEKIDGLNLLPLTLTEAIALVDRITLLNTLIWTRKPNERKKSSVISEWKSQLEKNRAELTLIHSKLNRVIIEDGSTIPNYFNGTVFCGTELCDPHPQLRNTLRYYPTIGCRLCEEKYRTIGKEWISPEPTLKIFHVACIDK